MTAGTSSSARAMAALFEKKARQDDCSHSYELPWVGCGYLQCKWCGKRINNDD